MQVFMNTIAELLYMDNELTGVQNPHCLTAVARYLIERNVTVTQLELSRAHTPRAASAIGELQEQH